MTSVTNKVKLFVLDPLWDSLTTKEQIKSLRKAGYELLVDSTPKPLKSTPGLFAGPEPRVLAINPDYIGWKLKNADYANIPNLKGIFVASTAFGWIEQDVAAERGIPISNIVDFSTQAVAEWAVLTALSLARQMPRLIKDDFPLDYNQDYVKYRGVELKGKVAGIVGLGNIGSAIAERCAGLGMKLVYYSRSPKNVPYEALELEKLFRTADVIFPALAKNEETARLVDGAMVRHVKPEAMLVDITGMFDRQRVLDMVGTGKLYGYGFEGEPAEFSSYKGNIWAAPAYAWATHESMQNSEIKLIDNLVAAANGAYPNKVN